MAETIGNDILKAFGAQPFDVLQMSKTLANAEVAGQRNNIETKQEKSNTELSALNYLQENLEAFDSYLTNLSDLATFTAKSATSSDDSVITATTTGSNPPSGSYQVEVKQLAQAHSLVTNKTFNSSSETLATGTLNIASGGANYNITIDSSNNTLEGLRNVINNGDYGVNASIINNGGVYQLMFTSKTTGAASEISVSGTADFDGLGTTTTATAQDALVSVNGLDVTSHTNVISGVLDGVDLTLNSADPGKIKSIQVNSDIDGLKQEITSFVEVFNQLDSILDTLGSYEAPELDDEGNVVNADDQYKSDLAGNSALRSVKAQIREAITGTIDQLDTPYNTLSSIGITTNLDGTLELDSADLSTALNSNLDAVARIFAKGGSSDDSLVKVVEGNSKTQTGRYDMNITQLAERATVSGGASTFATNEYRAGMDKVTNPADGLTIAPGASFDLDINGFSHNIALTAGTYGALSDVATEMQSQITSVFSGNGVSASVAYDATQNRFEVTTADGTLNLSNAVNLTTQGFRGASTYDAEPLMNIAVDGTFDAEIDDATSVAMTIRAGKYTLDEMAYEIQRQANHNETISGAGASITVTHDGSTLSITSDRYGANSKVALSNFANLGNAGLSADVTDNGQNVDGTITTPSGDLSIGAYASGDDGRRIEISDYAMIGSNEAEVRGLVFEVLGGSTGTRGPITFSQGFADKISATIDTLLDSDNGLITSRVDNLNNTLEDLDERTEKIDERFNALELKYRLQFSALTTLMQQMEQTRNQLSSTFDSLSNSD